MREAIGGRAGDDAGGRTDGHRARVPRGADTTGDRRAAGLAAGHGEDADPAGARAACGTLLEAEGRRWRPAARARMAMEHAEALERIEIAAAEPEGLERLMAGDTPDAAAVAGHLAGCRSCTGGARRDPADGRARPPRHRGRARPRAARADARVRPRGGRGRGRRAIARAVRRHRPAPVALAAVPRVAAARRPRSPALASARRRWSRPRSCSRIGAGVVAAARRRLRHQRRRGAEIAVLARPTRRALRVERPARRQRVALARDRRRGRGPGTLLFSPSTGELVAGRDATSRRSPTTWSTAAGSRSTATRTRIGKMYPGGDLRAWAGPVDGLADVPGMRRSACRWSRRTGRRPGEPHRLARAWARASGRGGSGAIVSGCGRRLPRTDRGHGESAGARRHARIHGASSSGRRACPAAGTPGSGGGRAGRPPPRRRRGRRRPASGRSTRPRPAAPRRRSRARGARVRQHEPRQRPAGDDADEQQPPVEVGAHQRSVRDGARDGPYIAAEDSRRSVRGTAAPGYTPRDAHPPAPRSCCRSSR